MIQCFVEQKVSVSEAEKVRIREIVLRFVVLVLGRPVSISKPRIGHVVNHGQTSRQRGLRPDQSVAVGLARRRRRVGVVLVHVRSARGVMMMMVGPVVTVGRGVNVNVRVGEELVLTGRGLVRGGRVPEAVEYGGEPRLDFAEQRAVVRAPRPALVHEDPALFVEVRQAFGACAWNGIFDRRSKKENNLKADSSFQEENTQTTDTNSCQKRSELGQGYISNE